VKSSQSSGFSANPIKKDPRNHTKLTEEIGGAWCD
jgi:hypothetical protein